MSDQLPTTPRVFLSYSWTSPEYSDTVERLAQDLAAAGIHVTLDQWDLTEGQDKYAFMERCVTDPAVTKVLILVDPAYAEKADARAGGVGTETLIITPEVYGSADQQKFIPVLMARDEEGVARLPAYLRGRIYIDLSDPERYEEGFERLLRNLHGRPQRERPQLGKRPAYLDESAVQLSTGRSLAAFHQALLQEKRTQAGYLADYLDRVAAAFDSERIGRMDSLGALELAASVSLDRWLPYRDEFVHMLTLLARYGERPELYDQLHGFFERLLNLRDGQTTHRFASELETENLAFIGWELYLYSLALLLRGGRFGAVQRLLQPFHIRDAHGHGEVDGVARVGAPFRLIQDERQQRLGTRWTSGPAALLRERLAPGVEWDLLGEADTFLWVRTTISQEPARMWYPLTVAFMENRGPGALALWQRLRADGEFFARMAPLLGVRDRDDAKARVANIPEGMRLPIGHVALTRPMLAHLLNVPS